MLSCKDYCQQEKLSLKDNMAPNCQLDIVQIGDNSASNAYIRGKIKDCKEVGINPILHKYGADISQNQLTEEIYKISKSTTNGIILQLPVPAHINADDALRGVILPWQDVDGFIYDRYIPCTPRGILDWLNANSISLEGKNVVVIGRSEIVGKPLAKEMTNRNATVTLCHSHTSRKTLEAVCAIADIIIVAVGKLGFFDIDCPNAIIIDVGINTDENGKLRGDVAPEVKAKYITPVPGGVGLLTRLALLKNTVV